MYMYNEPAKTCNKKVTSFLWLFLFPQVFVTNELWETAQPLHPMSKVSFCCYKDVIKSCLWSHKMLFFPLYIWSFCIPYDQLKYKVTHFQPCEDLYIYVDSHISNTFKDLLYYSRSTAFFGSSETTECSLSRCIKFIQVCTYTVCDISSVSCSWLQDC